MQSISSLLKPSASSASDGSGKSLPRPPLVVSQGRDPAAGPRFAPTARLVVTPYLRTSGLLASLPDGEVRTLLALLTFLTPDGRIQASAPQIAEALAISDRKGREHMDRLAAVSWEGRPVAFFLPREMGMDSIVLSPHLISYEKERSAPATAESAVPMAGREAIMARSRALYARPRAEVERMVMEQLGYPASEEEDTPEARVRRSLRAFGIAPGEADGLLSRFPVDRIERQIEWMGYRKAKRPKSYLLAAIENDYSSPVEIRLSSESNKEAVRLQLFDSESRNCNGNSDAN